MRFAPFVPFRFVATTERTFKLLWYETIRRNTETLFTYVPDPVFDLVLHTDIMY